MRRAFADFSPAVPAAFAAGLGVSLWIFLLPAGVVQKGPTSVLPAFGGAAGRVVADLPVAVGGRASEVRAAASAHSKLVPAGFHAVNVPAKAANTAINFTGAASFASATSYVCFASDVTAKHTGAVVTFTYSSGSQFRYVLSGSRSVANDTVDIVCQGR